MNPETGEYAELEQIRRYAADTGTSLDEASAALIGVNSTQAVEVRGTPDAVEKMSRRLADAEGMERLRREERRREARRAFSR
jgi:hypothetical protein